MSFLMWLAVLPSIIIGLLIYKADSVEQEPKKELLKAILMGCLAVVITLLLSLVFGVMKINMNSLNLFQTVIYSFVGIALIEEFSKWFCTKIFIRNNKNYDYLFDGIVYSVFVSLGFATIENILYTFTGGLMTALVRAVVTVPSHVFYAIFMGYYFSKAKDAKQKNNKNNYLKYSFYSLIIPVILHGTFDALLLLQIPILILIFIVFVIVLYTISIKKVKDLMKEERQFENKQILYCMECGNKVSGKYCSNCGKKTEQ